MTIKALYPTVRPTLNLDFAKTKVLDPRITFTRASTATFVGANGLIQTAASGVARFDHNPATGESLGLLVEEARTNYIKYSADLTQSNWTNRGVLITSSAAVSPDGTSNAQKLIGSTPTEESYPSITDTTNIITLPNGLGPYTASVYAKAADLNFLVFSISRLSDNNNSGWVVNLTSGESRFFRERDAFTRPLTVTSLSNGWFRISFNFSVTANNGYVFCLGVTDSLGTGIAPPVYTGNGTAGIYTWGAQLEAGSFPTSYIPTTTATVTRAADLASMTGTNFSSWFNSGAGTFFTDSSNDQLTSNIARSAYDQSNTVAFSLGSGSGRVYTPILSYLSNNTIYANLFQYNGGGTEWGPVLQNTIPNTANVRKVAVFTDTTNNVAGLCTAGQINVASKPVDPTRTGMLSYSLAQSMVIGYNSNYYGNYMGRIKRLAYYPVRLADAQLQALTAT